MENVNATVFNLLEEIVFSDPYRKSIWFFITLWVLTFLLSDEISYSGLYYLILLVATIVLLFEKCGIIDSENAKRKRFLTYFYVIFFLCMLPTLAVTLVFSAVGISHYDTQRWHSTWPSSKAGYIPSPLQAPKSLPESLKVASSAEVIGLGGSYSCLVLDGESAALNINTPVRHPYIRFTIQLLNYMKVPIINVKLY